MIIITSGQKMSSVFIIIMNQSESMDQHTDSEREPPPHRPACPVRMPAVGPPDDVAGLCCCAELIIDADVASTQCRHTMAAVLLTVH